MHENKFLLRKVHSIHHRAFSPLALEYLYVHPFEWMMGYIGPFNGIGIKVVVEPTLNSDQIVALRLIDEEDRLEAFNISKIAFYNKLNYLVIQ